MTREDCIWGCILGTAIGDAVGLRREGLSRRRSRRMYGQSPKPDLLFGRGLCSDDTEHTVMAGRALLASNGNVEAFSRYFAGDLRKWFACLPAGIGRATCRSCFKLLVGFSPSNSGVSSAGNGPAMRAGIVGVWAESDREVIELNRVSSRITHTDCKAEEGALLVARACRAALEGSGSSPREFIVKSQKWIEGEELRGHLRAAGESLDRGFSPEEFAAARGWQDGVSGYTNHTVPAAIYCWAATPNDFRRIVENAVMLGGDSDSVAAVAGSIGGAHLGERAIPVEWCDGLVEWPRTRKWMQQLASQLAQRNTQTKPPPMHWLATIPRNLVFATVVLTLGFRRLLPPY